MADAGGAIVSAVQGALEPVLPKETKLTPDKLLERVLKYIQNAMNDVNFNSGIQEAVDNYCDNFFGSLFYVLSDRNWVGDVDWTPVVHAAVSELFPQPILTSVPAGVLDAGVASSAERAVEEGRFWYGAHDLWGILQRTVGKTTQKKLKGALESGWKEAWATARTSSDEYVPAWIGATVRKLTDAGQGNPGHVLPEPAAGRLFMSLIGGGCLPKTGDIGQEPPRDDWESVVLPAVQQAYSPFPPCADLPVVNDSGPTMKWKASGGGAAAQAWDSNQGWGGKQGKGAMPWGGNQGYDPYGGKGGGGKDMSDMMAMMSQMNAMMQMMGKGKGGGDKGGWDGGKGGWDGGKGGWDGGKGGWDGGKGGMGGWNGGKGGGGMDGGMGGWDGGKGGGKGGWDGGKGGWGGGKGGW